jgi:hypothetical protein
MVIKLFQKEIPTLKKENFNFSLLKYSALSVFERLP